MTFRLWPCLNLTQEYIVLHSIGNKKEERVKNSMNVEEELLFRKTKFQILQKITFSHVMSIVAGSTTRPLMGMKGQKNDPNHTFTKPLKLNIFFCATP